MASKTCGNVCGTCVCRKKDLIYGHMYCAEFYSDKFGEERASDAEACPNYIAIPKKARKKNAKS